MYGQELAFKSSLPETSFQVSISHQGISMGNKPLDGSFEIGSNVLKASDLTSTAPFRPKHITNNPLVRKFHGSKKKYAEYLSNLALNSDMDTSIVQNWYAGQHNLDDQRIDSVKISFRQNEVRQVLVYGSYERTIDIKASYLLYHIKHPIDISHFVRPNEFEKIILRDVYNHRRKLALHKILNHNIDLRKFSPKYLDTFYSVGLAESSIEENFSKISYHTYLSFGPVVARDRFNYRSLLDFRANQILLLNKGEDRFNFFDHFEVFLNVKAVPWDNELLVTSSGMDSNSSLFAIDIINFSRISYGFEMSVLKNNFSQNFNIQLLTGIGFFNSEVELDNGKSSINSIMIYPKINSTYEWNAICSTELNFTWIYANTKHPQYKLDDSVSNWILEGRMNFSPWKFYRTAIFLKASLMNGKDHSTILGSVGITRKLFKYSSH